MLRTYSLPVDSRQLINNKLNEIKRDGEKERKEEILACFTLCLRFQFRGQ